MKYALVGGTRVQAEPKLRGVCPSCESEVISKCGKHVIWHWAHRSRSSCDPWWEHADRSLAYAVRSLLTFKEVPWSQ
ncbi:competence protein CoiA family protein [Pseudomonas mediterranea]|uniref:competence protein CoiA family protein n=1 Tax=Pseudomonas mediterranea TaxID=183795 RepID=UPI0022AB0C4A|nr:competence protein CoiA family protein [Pseudomonas mediterranea]